MAIHNNKNEIVANRWICLKRKTEKRVLVLSKVS